MPTIEKIDIANFILGGTMLVAGGVHNSAFAIYAGAASMIFAVLAVVLKVLP